MLRLREKRYKISIKLLETRIHKS